MVSLGGIITVNFKYWFKTFFDGWARLAQFFLIWMTEIKSKLYLTLKIPEFDWIFQNYSSFDHNVNEIR